MRVTKIARGAMERAKVPDWAQEQRRRKRRWAGHVARRSDGRWTYRMLDWMPTSWSRRVGRPSARWEDSIADFVNAKGNKSWRTLAEDRKTWSQLEDGYVQVGL